MDKSKNIRLWDVVPAGISLALLPLIFHYLPWSFSEIADTLDEALVWLIIGWVMLFVGLRRMLFDVTLDVESNLLHRLGATLVLVGLAITMYGVVTGSFAFFRAEANDTAAELEDISESTLSVSISCVGLREGAKKKCETEQAAANKERQLRATKARLDRQQAIHDRDVAAERKAAMISLGGLALLAIGGALDLKGRGQI